MKIIKLKLEIKTNFRRDGVRFVRHYRQPSYVEMRRVDRPRGKLNRWVGRREARVSLQVVAPNLYDSIVVLTKSLTAIEQTSCVPYLSPGNTHMPAMPTSFTLLGGEARDLENSYLSKHERRAPTRQFVSYRPY